MQFFLNREINMYVYIFLPEDFTLPDNFWDSSTREIKLGSHGLRLTVTKAGIKGRSEVPIDEMKKIRGNYNFIF